MLLDSSEWQCSKTTRLRRVRAGALQIGTGGTSHSICRNAILENSSIQVEHAEV